MLIVGLGNPGKKYQNTRHNVGFVVVDELEKKNLDNFILVKTEIFMNLSGKAIKKLIADYRLQIADLVIVHDDIDIPIGAFKIQRSRGAAGHKGVQSIIGELKTEDFWRIRVGICPKIGKPKNVEKFVLQNFTKREQKIIKEAAEEITKKLRSMPQLL